MTDLLAQAVCDSIGEHSPRLMTMFMRNPKMIHQETLRHRRIYIHDFLYDYDFSWSVSSARAIPFAKMLEEVRDDARRAAPVYWGAEQRGMSPGGELSNNGPQYGAVAKISEMAPKAAAQYLWKQAAFAAADAAERLYATGVHKSIANRVIEPYIHVNTLCTGTEKGWLNFFGLRLDGAADPTLRALAEAAWKVWNESKPKLLQPGEWHLPYADDEESFIACRETAANYHSGFSTGSACARTDATILGLLKQVSVARCARLSYQSFATGRRSTIEEDLELYQKLVGSAPIHASPAEHQATPDSWFPPLPNFLGTNTGRWVHPELAGNLGPGWVQYRKTLPNEEVAPLPEAYR